MHSLPRVFQRSCHQPCLLHSKKSCSWKLFHDIKGPCVENDMKKSNNEEVILKSIKNEAFETNKKEPTSKFHRDPNLAMNMIMPDLPKVQPKLGPLNFKASVHMKTPKIQEYLRLTANQMEFPSNTKRKYSTKSGSSGSKDKSEFIVCLRVGDKGCISPGNADNPVSTLGDHKPGIIASAETDKKASSGTKDKSQFIVCKRIGDKGCISPGNANNAVSTLGDIKPGTGDKPVTAASAGNMEGACAPKKQEESCPGAEKYKTMSWDLLAKDLYARAMKEAAERRAIKTTVKKKECNKPQAVLRSETTPLKPKRQPPKPQPKAESPKPAPTMGGPKPKPTQGATKPAPKKVETKPPPKQESKKLEPTKQCPIKKPKKSEKPKEESKTKSSNPCDEPGAKKDKKEFKKLEPVKECVKDPPKPQPKKPCAEPAPKQQAPKATARNENAKPETKKEKECATAKNENAKPEPKKEKE